MFEGGLGFCRGLDEALLSHVPPRRGVMLLLADDRRPIILMTAANMRSRLRARLKSPEDETRGKLPDLSKVTRQILWTQTTGAFETDLIYLERAAAIWPTHYAARVAWKPAWFIHVDPADRVPVFQRSRRPPAGPGRYFGPFATGRSADHFIGLLADVMDLCRKPTCVRQAPNGDPCTYAQMGKCLSVCDGTTSLANYARTVARAVELAEGNDTSIRQELTAQMESAAKELRFEAAASFKAKLAKLDELAGPAFADVAPIECFRFLLFQSGRGRKQAKVFLVDRGHVEPAGTIGYPLQTDELDALLARMADFARTGRPWTDLETYRLGLVVRCLPAGRRPRELMLRWCEELRRDQVAAAVEAAAEQLHLGPRAASES